MVELPSIPLPPAAKYNAIHPGRDAPQPGMVELIDTRLGRNLTLGRDQAPQSLIDASGTSLRAQVATIHAQVDIPADAYVGIGADRHAPILGLLQWGQGGAKFTATIDLRTGVCASVVASSVQLSAVYAKSDTLPGADTRALRANVGAAVVWGTRASRARVTRTLPRVTIPNAATQTFEVPEFADSVLFFVNASAFYAAASTSVITLHGGPTPTDDPEAAFLAGTLGVQPLTMNGLALSGDTRFVSLTNASGAGFVCRPSFNLAL
jgi:hypothetical protein